jgi:hypothetical protein
MSLTIRRVEAIGRNVARASQTEVARATLDIDTGELVAGDGPGGIEERPALVEELRSVWKPAHVEYLQARWHRFKRARAEKWRSQDWTLIDTEFLVPYFEVFADDWDLVVIHDREQFWLVDQWCLKPACSCEEFKVDVHRPGGDSLGTVNVTVKGWKVLGVDGDPLAGQLWSKFIREPPNRKTVLARQRAMRKVAKELPGNVRAAQGSNAAKPSADSAQPRVATDDRLWTAQKTPSAPQLAPQSVGRNDPCPCGSGKKYKKCCGLGG